MTGSGARGGGERPTVSEAATESFTYPEEFLASLATFGLRPTATTAPDLVRGALNDLYRYELRTLRGRLLAGEFERSAYLDFVVALRKKYWLLTLQLPAWHAICRAAP